MNKVYIMIDAPDGRRQVVDAMEYQQLALNDYIDNKIVDDLAEDLAYEIDDDICFTIKQFNSKKKSKPLFVKVWIFLILCERIRITS